MTTENKNERYFGEMCNLIKNFNDITQSSGRSHFNKTEFRLLSEVVTAKMRGERMISTQLAVALGVTRSAVSQMVARLEDRGVIRRVPDDIDRKIAYIELAEDTMGEYGEDLVTFMNFYVGVIGKFGEKNFGKLCDLLNDFTKIVNTEKRKSKSGK